MRLIVTSWRLVRVSPMSPTQTEPGPAGARASTSVGSSDQCVTPTVAPVRSTAKTRPASPESLVVRKRPSCTTRPLASTIAGSWKEKAVVPCGASGVTASPTAKGAATSRPTRALGIQQLAQPWPDPPRRHQLVVLLAGGATRHRLPGPDGAEQGVAGRVLAAD